MTSEEKTPAQLHAEWQREIYKYLDDADRALSVAMQEFRDYCRDPIGAALAPAAEKPKAHYYLVGLREAKNLLQLKAACMVQDNGVLMFTDENGDMIATYAPGVWKVVLACGAKGIPSGEAMIREIGYWQTPQAGDPFSSNPQGLG